MHQRKKLQTTRIKKKKYCKPPQSVKFKQNSKQNSKVGTGKSTLVQGEWFNQFHGFASFWLKKKAKKANKAIGLDSLEVVTKNRQFPGILLVNKIGSWQKKK